MSVANKRKRQSGMPSNVNSDVDAARSGLVSLNQLSYQLQPDLSVAVSRKHTTSFAQQREYTENQKALIILNTGSSYVDPQNTFLKLTVTRTGGTNPGYWGWGSAGNLFRRLVISTRDGSEIERLDQCHKLNAVLDRYTKSKHWMDTVGSMAGYSSRPDKKQQEPDAISPADQEFVIGYNTSDSWDKLSETKDDSRTYIIPMACVSSLFRSTSTLLPSVLMSGLRIELELETSGFAIRSTDYVYKVSDIEVHTDAYQLTDSITRVLNEHAALQGLEIPIITYAHVSDVVSAGQNNYEVRKAVSRALSVITKFGPKTGVGEAKDSMRSSPWRLTSFQTRCGSLYFPNNPISGATSDETVAQAYHTTLQAFGKHRAPSSEPAVTLEEFRNKFGVITTSLERSSMLNLTGIPINSSRIAENRVTYTADGAAPANAREILAANTQVDTWISFVRLVRVFLNSVQIEE